jgi:hypothetical protein
MIKPICLTKLLQLGPIHRVSFITQFFHPVTPLTRTLKKVHFFQIPKPLDSMLELISSQRQVTEQYLLSFFQVPHRDHLL